MVRTKYTFEKRQKEIAKKKKQEEKAARRAETKKSLHDEESLISDENHEALEAETPAQEKTPD